MKKETWLVMLGCAIGAFIGGLIAFEIQSRLIWGQYLWIFGAFFGGCIGWCMGEFGELRNSIMRSYRVSKENLSRELRAIMKWRPDWGYWKASLMLIAGLTASLVSSVSLVVVMNCVFHDRPPVTFIEFLVMFFSGLVIICALLASLILFAVLMILPWFKEKGDDEFSIGRLLFKYGNPISLPFVCIAVLFIGLRNTFLCLKENREEIADAMEIFTKEVRMFIKRAFIYAHSEKRRIRFIGAFLGTVAGFFLGSAILGAVAGAIIGGISREIAIRWLKLVPSV